MPGQTLPEKVPKDTGHVASILYQASDLISIGTKISPVTMHDDEHIDIYWTSGVDGLSGVSKDADVDFKNLTYTKITGDMVWDKYPFMIMDSSKLRTIDAMARQKNLKSGADWLAGSLDNHILSALHGGAGQSEAATDTWDAATADIEADIKAIWQACAANSNANTNEIFNCYLIVPMDVYGEVKSLQLINNQQVQFDNYFKGSLGITIFPTRDYGSGSALGNDALFVFAGDNTSATFRFNPSSARAKGVPLVETERIVGKGDGYIAQQAHKTIIIEDSAGAGTTSRIGKITDVRS
jgi:hypothetical protein